MSKSDELHKHTLHLYLGDYQRLQEYYPEIGAAVVVRKLVRKHLDQLDATAKVNKPVNIAV